MSDSRDGALSTFAFLYLGRKGKVLEMCHSSTLNLPGLFHYWYSSWPTSGQHVFKTSLADLIDVLFRCDGAASVPYQHPPRLYLSCDVSGSVLKGRRHLGAAPLWFIEVHGPESGERK